jgi:hypothetical protein
VGQGQGAGWGHQGPLPDPAPLGPIYEKSRSQGLGRIPWPPRGTGNFGGGRGRGRGRGSSTGPDQIFLGITRAPPSALGRGRAQSPARQKPNPQATNHGRHASGIRDTRAAARVGGFLFPISYETIGTKQLLTRGSLLRMEWAPSRRVGAASKGQLGN